MKAFDASIYRNIRYDDLAVFATNALGKSSSEITSENMVLDAGLIVDYQALVVGGK